METKLDLFIFVNEVTVDVSCEKEIYFEVPRPSNVEVVPYNPS
jgi:hypothetical protein